MDGIDTVVEESGCFDNPMHLYRTSRSHEPPDEQDVDRMVRIARAIEGEVIPRLLLVHRRDGKVTGETLEAESFDAQTPEKLARMVLTQHDDTALAFVHGLLASGFPLESVYLDLLAPAARWLGRQWELDDLSFTDVTIGLSRLQRLMRMLGSSASAANRREPLRSGRIMLALVPGEQHLFGLLMLEEFLRSDGWDVECLPSLARADLIDAIRRSRPRVVGLSVSVDERLDETRRLIGDVRSAAGNPDLLVMVGGRCFVEHPEYAGLVGADFTAVDGRQAISDIRRHLSNGSDTW